MQSRPLISILPQTFHRWTNLQRNGNPIEELTKCSVAWWLFGFLCGEFTGQRWIPLTKASGAKLWCFMWSTPWKKTVEQTIVRPVIWDAIALIMTSLWWQIKCYLFGISEHAFAILFPGSLLFISLLRMHFIYAVDYKNHMLYGIVRSQYNTVIKETVTINTT